MEDIYEGPAELPGHPPKIIKKKFESDISQSGESRKPHLVDITPKGYLKNPRAQNSREQKSKIAFLDIYTNGNGSSIIQSEQHQKRGKSKRKQKRTMKQEKEVNEVIGIIEDMMSAGKKWK